MTYFDDLSEQPAALERLLDQFESWPVPGELSTYDRILVTGMGGSHFANYYLWRRLHRAGLPVQWVASDELISFDDESWMRGRTLVWAVSQSGQSGELLEFIRRLEGRADVDVLAVTNTDSETELTRRADWVQPIHAGPEATVGTKTYTNTVAANDLLAERALGGDVSALVSAYRSAATGIRDYLDHDWRGDLAPLARAAALAKAFVLVGRGPSHGTALEGALVLKEAVKVHVEGLTVGQFRHGPLELADDDLVMWLFGDRGSGALDNEFARSILGFGARLATTGIATPPDGALAVPAPLGPARADPILQMIPVQLASVVIGEVVGMDVGVFRNSRKVTTGL